MAAIFRQKNVTEVAQGDTLLLFEKVTRIECCAKLLHI